MQQWIVPAVLGALCLASVALAVVLHRSRATTARELRSSHAETASLRAQLEEIERRLATPVAPTPPRADPDYVITHLGEAEQAGAGAAVERIDSALFADLVLRETVVKAASFAHGVRRALSPETRNRIRFEMRREVKRSRKQRRTDRKHARRAWEAAQRADEDAA
jgi:hypothetical protein